VLTASFDLDEIRRYRQAWASSATGAPICTTRPVARWTRLTPTRFRTTWYLSIWRRQGKCGPSPHHRDRHRPRPPRRGGGGVEHAGQPRMRDSLLHREFHRHHQRDGGGRAAFRRHRGLVLEKLCAPARGAAADSEPPVFAAHNARFDYSFLRAEFRRAGVPSPRRCSARSSCRGASFRAPETQPGRGDGAARLTCSARHRALGDARCSAVLVDPAHSIAEPDLAAAARCAQTR